MPDEAVTETSTTPMSPTGSVEGGEVMPEKAYQGAKARGTHEPGEITEGMEDESSPRADLIRELHQKSVNGEDLSAEAAPAEQEGEQPTETPPEEPEEPAEPAVVAPEPWPKVYREHFEKLQAEDQQFILDRVADTERDYTAKMEEVAQARQAIEPYVEAVSQVQPYLQQIGADPIAYFGDLANAEYALRTGTNEQKIAVLRQLAELYGVTRPDPDAPPPNPQIEALNQRMGGIESILTGAQRQQQTRQQEAANAEAMAPHEAAIAEFKEAKDEAGNLLHPYFDELYPRMIREAQLDQAEGKQPDLNDLYDRASHADPVVRAKIAAAQQKQARVQQQAADQAKADRTRKAASSISGAGSSASPTPTTDRRAIIAELVRG